VVRVVFHEERLSKEPEKGVHSANLVRDPAAAAANGCRLRKKSAKPVRFVLTVFGPTQPSSSMRVPSLQPDRPGQCATHRRRQPGTRPARAGRLELQRRTGSPARSPPTAGSTHRKGIMKILMWIIIAIFLIGLLVVIGAGKLIF
jgi:hypothetical protein